MKLVDLSIQSFAVLGSDAQPRWYPMLPYPLQMGFPLQKWSVN